MKTGNVLLQFVEGDGLMAKVSDFGTVRVNKETQQNALATSVKTHASTKQVCGTTPYMPPGAKEWPTHIVLICHFVQSTKDAVK